MNNKECFPAPRKSLGQNFLQDPNIIRKIVASLGIHESDTVIEIGPGRGALTELILPLTNDLHLIEFDWDLSAYWQERSESLRNLTVHANDVLKFDFSEIIDQVFSRDKNTKIKVIGNLPYNISSPVLFHLRQYADSFDSQIVMLQKEVVDRMASPPNCKQYGRLSVMLQQRYSIENLFSVPAGAFYPPPKVESAIARLTPLGTPLHPVNDHQNFEKIVKQAFSQRRKTLRNTLKGLLDIDQIESVGVEPSARAETLGVVEFAKLSNLLD